MKKLLLLSFCLPMFSYALTKNDLEFAIRSLDVALVKNIIENEKFTSREYNRYLDLAQEVVHNRESWVAKIYPMYDIATPYEGPSFKRLIPEVFVGRMAFNLGIFCTVNLIFFNKMGWHYEKKELLAAGAIASFSVVGKVLCDLKKRFGSDQAYKELLRKKYDDAVTIKQLIYAAAIVEA